MSSSGSLSPLDDLPIHQIAEPIRRVGTGDRNFYDRYYFNLHSSSGQLMLVTGLGVYPNLGVLDAYVVVRHDDMHRVVRASRELGVDRMDTSVGPFRIEVLEGLRRLRVICEPNEWGVAMDCTWEGAEPAHEEPRHFIREFDRVTFDTCRLAQTGSWSGTIEVAGQTFDVTPDRWWGTRDRSWGVRPIGEPEPPGIRATAGFNGMFWLYTPTRFDDFSVFCIVQEKPDGTRVLEEAVRVWKDGERGVESLGRPEHRLDFEAGTRRVKRAEMSFTAPDGRPLTMSIEPLLQLHVGIGTGYGFDADWRHGMYQGALKVAGVTYDLRNPEDAVRMFGIVDSVARCELDGQVGYGLFEYMVLGPHERYGFTDFLDGFGG